ncbi:MAG: PadR family transcriptional regulator [Curvibacter sp.]|jgi:DNA-binding PadR family transcriptional regulator|nr:PadR family transcriptional regulator [Curvibacter sp.]
MSLPHALITALIEQDACGSDLASRFDRSIGYFWHATHQQIYRELGRLEVAGWVESLPPESGRGRKRVYRVLPAGRKELQRWVAEQQDPKPMRDELMVRLWAEAVIGPTGLVKEIRSRIDLHKEKLALYGRIESRDFPSVPRTREAALRRLVLHSGIQYERYWLEILSAALGVLDRPAKECLKKSADHAPETLLVAKE